MRHYQFRTFEAACMKARQVSRDQRCTVHVNAIVSVVETPDNKPSIMGYNVSDWYNHDATLAIFTDGHEGSTF